MIKTLEKLVLLGMLGISCAQQQKTSQFLSNQEIFGFYNIPSFFDINSDNVSSLSLVYDGDESLKDAFLEYRVVPTSSKEGAYKKLSFRFHEACDGAMILTTDFSPASMQNGDYILEVRGIIGKERYMIKSNIKIK